MVDRQSRGRQSKSLGPRMMMPRARDWDDAQYAARVSLSLSLAGFSTSKRSRISGIRPRNNGINSII